MDVQERLLPYRLLASKDMPEMAQMIVDAEAEGYVSYRSFLKIGEMYYSVLYDLEQDIEICTATVPWYAGGSWSIVVVEGDKHMTLEERVSSYVLSVTSGFQVFGEPFMLHRDGRLVVAQALIRRDR